MGVFLPSILTIFGLILFLRLGWIIGAGGLATSLLVISLASLITLITSFSISSTVTNMKMGAGGVYYMLSRTFGLEAGSAISLPLYLAQAIGISFYISGFTETLSPFFPGLSPLLISFSALIGITFLASFSTSVALKSQLIIFGFLCLALLSIFLGKPQAITPSEGIVLPSYSFWMLFPLFFPAMTGIEAGLGLSGELKKPRYSLPVGTIAAVLIGFLFYIFLSIFISRMIPREVLLTRPHILQDIAWIKQLVLVGIWGATLSSSISYLISAPRTLKAFSEDGVIPKFFGKDDNNRSIPRIAILTTSLIALCGLLLGGIDRLAPILTMFFLLSYSMLNLATSLEGFFENPSWRPSFRIPPIISFAGFFICIFSMLMIDVQQTLFALSLVITIYLVLKRRFMKSRFDDIRHTILLFLSRLAIYRLAKTKKGPKSWRPNLLTFVGDPVIRAHLIKFTQNVTHGKGFLSIASIFAGNEREDDLEFLSYREKIQNFFAKESLPALIEIKNAPSIMEGMKTLVKDYGIGTLVPNTIVLGATRKEDQFSVYAEVIMMAFHLQKNIIIIRESPRSLLKKKKEQKYLDVWWGGQSRRNSDLMLVFAYMLQSSQDWRGSRLYLKSVISHEKYREVMLKNLREFSSMGRLHIYPEVVLANKEEGIFNTIQKNSEEADLVFLGLRPPKVDESVEEYAAYYKSLLENTEDYPPIAFVLAGEAFSFGDILK